MARRKKIANMTHRELKAFATRLVDIEIRKPNGDMGVISIERHMVPEFNLAINKMLEQWHSSGKFYVASNRKWK